MSNSIGNLKNSGLQGNNFPWQLKMLQGLQAIYDEVKLPLTCAEDSIRLCDGQGHSLDIQANGSINVNVLGSIPVSLDCNDSITICNSSFTNDGVSSLNVHVTNPLPLEVNLEPDNDAVGMYGYTDINDPLNPTAILVNSAGQLDIRPLTCADEVSLCFNDGVSNVTVSSTNPLPVNAIVTVPNLNCETDSVSICDFASGNSLVPNANGSVSSQTLDGTGNAITSTSFISGEQALDVNVVNNLDCSTDSVAICDGAGNALVINGAGGPSDGSINSVLVDLTTGNPAVINPDGTQNNAIYGYDPVSVQNEAITSTASGTSQALDVNIVTPNLAVSLGSQVVPAGVTGDLSAFGPNITSITFQNIGTAVATISVDGGSNFFPLAPGTVINLDPRVPMGYYNGTSFYWDTTTVGASLLIIYNYI